VVAVVGLLFLVWLAGNLNPHGGRRLHIARKPLEQPLCLSPVWARHGNAARAAHDGRRRAKGARTVPPWRFCARPAVDVPAAPACLLCVWAAPACCRPAVCLLPPASCLLPPASCLLPPASAALFVFLVVLGRLGSSCVMYSIHRERSNDTATPVRLQPRLASPRLASPHHTTPHYTTLHRTTPHRTTPHLTSPHPSPAALPCAPGDALSAHQRPSGALCVRILRKLMPYHAARLPAPSASRRLCKSPQTVSLGGPRAPEAGN
jgi:hypothetical protein